tara:strand:+ start:836 stop:3001 length:2166 start_codon:yes stop_codon:yes gene_type:complete
VANFLLEIGTEELPADFARLVIPQLESIVLNDFENRRLNYGKILCTTTPRRITVLIHELADFANDFEEERKGPPVSQAFKEDKPTQAAIGFAKRLGMEVQDLEIKDTPKGPFVFGKEVAKGEPSKDLLIDLIPKWIRTLQGKRFMKWGNKDTRFSRPIRWLVALLDDEVVPVVITGTEPEVISTNLSRGHRLFSSELEIKSALEYLSCLENVGVIADRERRLRIIRKSVNDTSKKLKAKNDLSDELLDELTDLVEYPSIVVGEIDEKYLNLPPEVLTTVMKVHQRYVPLYDNDSSVQELLLSSKGVLLNKFICVSNGLENSNKTVREGNEKVLRARLSDAEFFLNNDLNVSSEDRSKMLDRIIFSKGLGSLLDRVNRIKWITQEVTSILQLDDNISSLSIKAAELSKNDLPSQMVGEFPELEGIMGAKYLLSEGKHEDIALAVLEQYLPKSAGGCLPQSVSGSVLAFSDKMELILSIFSKGERPTGSSDPYALRRAGNGIIQIIWSRNWSLDINYVLQNYLTHWSKILPNLNIDRLLMLNQLSEFFRQRIISLLEEVGIDVDLVQSVTSNENSINRLLSDPSDARIRANLLSSMRQEGKLDQLKNVVNRASRLADKGYLEKNILSPLGLIDDSLFEKKSEFELLELINSIEPITQENTDNKYTKLSNRLVLGSEILENFFDGDDSVMVMVDDLGIRNNRLNLLGILRNQAYLLADFSKINC